MYRIDLAALPLNALLRVRQAARDESNGFGGPPPPYLTRVALSRRIAAVNDELALRELALCPDDTSRLAWVVAGDLTDEFIAHFGSAREAEKFLEQLDPRS